MVRGEWNDAAHKKEGDYIHQVNGETSSFPEESTLTDAHPATYPTGFFIQGKQIVCVADHSPPPSIVVTNEWSCTSTPLHAFMHRDNFTLLLVMTHTIVEFSWKVPGKLY